jgi:hypothetical protein
VAPPPACFVRWVMGPTARIRGLDGVYGEGSDGIDARHIHALKYREMGEAVATLIYIPFLPPKGESPRSTMQS